MFTSLPSFRTMSTKFQLPKCPKQLIGAPKAWPRKRLHNFPKSNRSESSSSDARANASSLIRGLSSLMIFSHRSSADLSKRNRAKSVTSTFLSIGNASKISMSSTASALIDHRYGLYSIFATIKFTESQNFTRLPPLLSSRSHERIFPTAERTSIKMSRQLLTPLTQITDSFD